MGRQGPLLARTSQVSRKDSAEIKATSASTNTDGRAGDTCFSRWFSASVGTTWLFVCLQSSRCIITVSPFTPYSGIRDEGVERGRGSIPVYLLKADSNTSPYNVTMYTRSRTPEFGSEYPYNLLHKLPSSLSCSSHVDALFLHRCSICDSERGCSSKRNSWRDTDEGE